MSLVDDSSTNKTVSITEEMKQQDSRIQLFQFERNSRTVIARNKALTKTEGNNIGFLYAANLWKPPNLEKPFSRSVMSKSGSFVRMNFIKINI